MAGRRTALIVANDVYEHEGLGRLRSPAADAQALAGVLGDPAIGAFEVEVVRNEAAHVIEGRIEDLFADSRRDDVLLLHFSCHGIKSESGELFFAATNTRPNRLGSTAVSADFVQRCLRMSRSRSIVLLLDCCYGGAFSKGVTVRAAGDANVLDSFAGGRLGGGRGRAVITASSATEYAFEGDRLADDHSSPSLNLGHRRSAVPVEERGEFCEVLRAVVAVHRMAGIGDVCRPELAGRCLGAALRILGGDQRAAVSVPVDQQYRARYRGQQVGQRGRFLERQIEQVRVELRLRHGPGLELVVGPVGVLGSAPRDS